MYKISARRAKCQISTNEYKESACIFFYRVRLRYNKIKFICVFAFLFVVQKKKSYICNLMITFIHFRNIDYANHITLRWIGQTPVAAVK